MSCKTLLALYRRGGERGRFQVHYLNVESELRVRLTKNGKVGLPKDTGAPWIAPVILDMFVSSRRQRLCRRASQIGGYEFLLALLSGTASSRRCVPEPGEGIFLSFGLRL
jgi:hypothetical protein